MTVRAWLRVVRYESLVGRKTRRRKTRTLKKWRTRDRYVHQQQGPKQHLDLGHAVPVMWEEK